MSRYIKQDDVFELVRTGVLVSNSNFESVCKHIGSLPTIEVSEDAISRADLIESFLADCECKSRKEARAVILKLDDMLELIDDAPSVIPQQKEGEWYRQTTDHFDYWECSECGMGVGLDDIKNYCPNCGAKMKGADDE